MLKGRKPMVPRTDKARDGDARRGRRSLACSEGTNDNKGSPEDSTPMIPDEGVVGGSQGIKPEEGPRVIRMAEGP